MYKVYPLGWKVICPEDLEAEYILGGTSVEIGKPGAKIGVFL